jgi:hypothetical protein
VYHTVGFTGAGTGGAGSGRNRIPIFGHACVTWTIGFGLVQVGAMHKALPPVIQKVATFPPIEKRRVISATRSRHDH